MSTHNGDARHDSNKPEPSFAILRYGDKPAIQCGIDSEGNRQVFVHDENGDKIVCSANYDLHGQFNFSTYREGVCAATVAMIEGYPAIFIPDHATGDAITIRSDAGCGYKIFIQDKDNKIKLCISTPELTNFQQQKPEAVQNG